MQELSYLDLVDDSVKQKLLDYKYKGQDDSILYKKLISPLCQYIVDKHLPTTLAPNTITIIGFFVNLLPFFLLVIMDTPGQPASGWLSVIQGICILIYSICDNCDGKQARKIGASSSLGLLFDHGCDSIATCIISIAVCRVAGVSFFITAFVTSVCSFLFLLVTLEHYYTDYLYLPIVNAVSEGIWGLALFCIVSGLIGPDIWLLEPLGIQNNKLILVPFLITSVVTAIFHIKRILAKTDRMDLLLKCRFPLAFIFCTILIYASNPSIFDYTYLFVMTLNMGKISIICLISHVIGKEYQPIRFVNLAILVIFVLTFLFTILNQEVRLIKHVIFAMSMLDFINFCIMISKRMAFLLGIRVFSIKPSSATSKNTKPEVNLAPIPDAISESQEFKKESTHRPENPEVNDTL